MNRLMRAMALVLLVAASVAAVTSCATMTPEQIRAQTLEYVRVNNRPDYVRDALLELRPVRGMHQGDIRYLYGAPSRVNRSSYGTQAVYSQLCAHSRDLYQENIYVYFENGIVTDWQIGGCIY